MSRLRSLSFLTNENEVPIGPEMNQRKEEIYNAARKKVRFGPIKECVERLNHWGIINCKEPFTDEEINLGIEITEELEDPANLLEAYACIRIMLRNRKNPKSVFLSCDPRLQQFINKQYLLTTIGN